MRESTPRTRWSIAETTHLNFFGGGSLFSGSSTFPFASLALDALAAGGFFGAARFFFGFSSSSSSTMKLSSSSSSSGEAMSKSSSCFRFAGFVVLLVDARGFAALLEETAAFFLGGVSSASSSSLSISFDFLRFKVGVFFLIAWQAGQVLSARQNAKLTAWALWVSPPLLRHWIG